MLSNNGCRSVTIGIDAKLKTTRRDAGFSGLRVETRLGGLGDGLGDLRTAGEEMAEILDVERQKLAPAARRDSGGAGRTAQQGDLAEEVAILEQGFATGAKIDGDGAIDDEIHAVADIADPDEHI